MATERSAGVIVYREPRQYLLLLKKRSVDFPKGKLERGESLAQAAVRETREETGLLVELDPSFRRTIHYKYAREGVQIDKTVTFFLARVEHGQRVTVSKEHKGYAWLTLPRLMRRLSKKNAKWLVNEAERYLGVN